MEVGFGGLPAIEVASSLERWVSNEIALSCDITPFPPTMALSTTEHLTLQLRIYALYDASPRIAALMISALSVEVLIIIGMFGIVSEAAGNMVRCNVTVVPAWFGVFCAAPTSFERLLCVLAMYKGYQRVQSLANKALQNILFLLAVSVAHLSFLSLRIQAVYIIKLIWLKDVKASLEVITVFAVALPSVMSGWIMINVRHCLSTPDTPSETSLGQFSLPASSNNDEVNSNLCYYYVCASVAVDIYMTPCQRRLADVRTLT
ncbi:hypothetical protein B0H19DRAFT_1064560 [Mycena capillaripes]|nr:hypothetical protein B0H19DRAFT_1064560 [Mycena capillaripes]